ncbi:MAG: hypothetical protein RBU29_13380, partial [bacterium]|nr:hypothetical protein [bacterium]
DRYGIAFSSVDLMENYPMNAVWPAPLVRAMTVFPDHTYAVMDAFAGRHTNPRKPARDVVHGLPEDFYFWGFDIIWDMEPVYPGKE